MIQIETERVWLVLNKTIERIRMMERYFDMLQEIAITNPNALREGGSSAQMLQTLARYYENGQWLRDYELDEQGLLPQNLKRGVLSQDALYAFLEIWLPGTAAPEQENGGAIF